MVRENIGNFIKSSLKESHADHYKRLIKALHRTARFVLRSVSGEDDFMFKDGWNIWMDRLIGQYFLLREDGGRLRTSHSLEYPISPFSVLTEYEIEEFFQDPDKLIQRIEGKVISEVTFSSKDRPASEGMELW